MADERDRESGIVAAYLAGKKIADIEAEFGVGRSTIFHYLRRAGRVPDRSKRQLEADSKDAVLAGLYELIRLQDQRIEQADDTTATLRKRLAAAERKAARLQAALGNTNGAVRSKESRAG